MNWSQQQQAIFSAVADTDSLIVEAVAGSGKTTTIVEAIKHVPSNKSVAFVAFNKSIAEELSRRITSPNARAMTLHSAGWAAWRRSLGWDCDNCRVDNLKVREITSRALGWKDYSKIGGEVCRLVALGKQTGIVPLCRPSNGSNWSDTIHANGLIEDTDEAWQELIDHYTIDIDICDIGVARQVLADSIQLAREVIDFDDMLYMPIVIGVEFDQYDIVFVDEAQDVSGIQMEMISRMNRSPGRTIAVGDRRQAIYGFRGAHANSMDLIRDRFQARELPLSTTYRCAQTIVQHAQQWTPQIEAAEGVAWGYVGQEGTNWRGQAEIALGAPVECHCPEDISFHDAGCPAIKENNDALGLIVYDDGGVAICGKQTEGISKWRGIEDFRPEDAILCRVTRPLVAVAFELVRKRVPCRILGRDIGSGLIALVRKYSKKKRVGDNTIAEFMNWLDVYVEKECERLASRKQTAAAGALRDKAATVDVFAQEIGLDAPVSGLIAEIERMFNDNGAGVGRLTLATVHKSKGLEWERVFVLDAGECMPSRWARQEWELEQERNLMYVAATRAKQELRYITSEDLGIYRRSSHVRKSTQGN